MGVGSEVYGAVRGGRKGIGIELKPSYYRQAVKNVQAAATDDHGQLALIAEPAIDTPELKWDDAEAGVA